FGEITWKYKIDELINKYSNILNEIINKGYDSRITNLSNELLEILEMIKNCTSCNLRKYNLYEFYKSINEIENRLAELEKEKKKQGKRKIINELNCKLIEIDDESNRKALCESCKWKKIEKLTDKCENEEMARLL